MTLPASKIPAPGFVRISGERPPPDKTAKWIVQFRNGWIDAQHTYTADQIRWKHHEPPCAWDVVAVRKVGE